MTQMHQPFASLIAIDAGTARITHASVNSKEMIGHEPQRLLDANARELLGREFWHGLKNAAAHPGFATRAVSMTSAGLLADGLEMRAFSSGPLYVVEVSPGMPSEFGSTPVLDVAQSAMSQFLPLDTEDQLLKALVTLMRHFSGYDHVVLWKQDVEGQAIAAAESKRQPRETRINTQAPWSDLWPDHAATIGIVADISAQNLSLLEATGDPVAAPDLSRALCHPVSARRIDDLKSWNSVSSICLRFTRKGAPWCVVECLTPYARRPSSAFLSLVEALVPFLDVKLQTIQAD